MKIRYSVTQSMTYEGIIDVDEYDYNMVKDEDDETIGTFILEHVNLKHPTRYYTESVDEFEAVKEPPMCGYCHHRHYGYQDHVGG